MSKISSLSDANNGFYAVKNAIKFIAVCVLFIWATGQLQAQTIYKSVDKQGHVTFSEIPPSAASGSRLVSNSVDSSVGLPAALQQIVNRYPVTLYTSANCSPCINARLLLSQRGVPFSERMVNSNEDIEAYQRLSRDNSLPMVSIGSQQIKGFNSSEWHQFLDAAGYPKTSALPRNYSNPAASPLVVAGPKTTEKPSITDKPPAVVGRPATDKSTNPAGIRF